jgi:thioredoxin-related protein
MNRLRLFFLCGGLALSGAMLPTVVAAAELLMFERAGCPWCQRWNRDVGPVYSNTEEGRRAPLRRIDLDGKNDLSQVLREPVRYTPTFVLIENGREIGRLVGYINNETFWGMLANLLTKLDGK